MPISRENQVLLQGYSDSSAQPTWQLLTDLLGIWEESRTFCSWRSYKPKGMPTGLYHLDRILYVEGLRRHRREADADWKNEALPPRIIAAIGMVLRLRRARGSASTRDRRSISSQLFRCLTARMPKTEEASELTDGSLPKDENGVVKDAAKILGWMMEPKYDALRSASVNKTIETLEIIIRSIDRYAHKTTGYYSRINGVPFHTEEYQTDLDVKNALVNLVNTVVVRYLIAQGGNMRGVFFNKLHGGNCLEGRTRAVLNWCTGVGFSKGSDFMEKASSGVQNFLVAVGFPLSHENMVNYLFLLCRQKSFVPEEGVCPQGYFRIRDVTSYVVAVLGFDQDDNDVDSIETLSYQRVLSLSTMNRPPESTTGCFAPRR